MVEKVIVLEQEVDIHIPYGIFVRNTEDFVRKHRAKGRLVYSTNSDGKFRIEYKTAPDSEEYIVRLSGWNDRKGDLHLRRLYIGQGLVISGVVSDFFDLLTTWALDHKGTFRFKYLDTEEPLLDMYDIQRGLEKDHFFTDYEMQELLRQHGKS